MEEIKSETSNEFDLPIPRADSYEDSEAREDISRVQENLNPNEDIEDVTDEEKVSKASSKKVVSNSSDIEIGRASCRERV